MNSNKDNTNNHDKHIIDNFALFILTKLGQQWDLDDEQADMQAELMGEWAMEFLYGPAEPRAIYGDDDP